MRARVSKSDIAERLTRVLLVDDERLVIRAMRRLILSRHPEWDVLCAHSVDSALRILAEYPVDVMVTDLNMPEVDGVVLLNIACQRYPRMARVVHSAHIEVFGPEDVQDLCVAVLAKPAGATELVGAIELASRGDASSTLVAG